MRWLRDREQLKMLYQRYAFGVDSRNFEIVRSVFHPDCRVSGTLEEGALDPYLEGIEEGLQQWEATMHFMGNQYVEIDGDRAHATSDVQASHMIDGERVVLAGWYDTDLRREGGRWRIARSQLNVTWTAGPPELYQRASERFAESQEQD